MNNVLDETKHQRVIALGRLGWALRRIESATSVRRETISGYLKAAGVAVHRGGGRSARWPPPNPANTSEVSTDSGRTPITPGRAPTASVCEAYRELILWGSRRGRTQRRSGKTWLISTASRVVTRASVVMSGVFAAT